jgi:DNA-binding MarR family transcriptional regulator
MASRTKSDGDTIVLSKPDAREIARLLRLLEPTKAEHDARYLREAEQPDCNSPAPIPRTELVARAQAFHAERNRRARFFNRSIFGEPAWDMLLSLYIMDGRPLSAGQLANMIGAPQTTALRWLQYLEKEGFVARSTDPDDRRFTRIGLLDQGRQLLDAYFSSLPEGFGASG